ncbi:hypothetical protein U9M48_015431 [Paspalum notatum var. saurae]|uniref:Uncharacterized protein n=1 Tax=Paspalum notatum var. saurae TaxID=547442 RepID=A0AAQ3T6J0_PASNO
MGHLLRRPCRLLLPAHGGWIRDFRSCPPLIHPDRYRYRKNERTLSAIIGSIPPPRRGRHTAVHAPPPLRYGRRVVEEPTRPSVLTTLVPCSGYMAPEYASVGIFSVKRRVQFWRLAPGDHQRQEEQRPPRVRRLHQPARIRTYLGCKKPKTTCLQQQETLGAETWRVTQAWQLWREGRAVELIDPALGECGEAAAILR